MSALGGAVTNTITPLAATLPAFVSDTTSDVPSPSWVSAGSNTGKGVSDTLAPPRSGSQTPPAGGQM
jgi:hypothetical protein